jgi:O-antigen/teichoic acid export membrane protein
MATSPVSSLDLLVLNVNSTIPVIASTCPPATNGFDSHPPIRPEGLVKEYNPALKGRGIRSNLAWMVAGTVWSGLCQWALLVALAKLGTVDMVGAFTLGMAIALPVLMFSCLNLRALYVTDCNYTYRFREYLALRLLMAAASVGFASLLAVAGGYSRDLVLAISLITLAKAFEYISDILYGLLQRQERMTAISISMMLRGTLSLCTLSVAVYSRGSLVWGAAGLALSSAVILLAFDVPVSLSLLDFRFGFALRECAAYARGTFAGGSGEYRRLRSLALAGVPLGLVLMLVSLNLNIPRYFVERSLGIREQGIFSSLANLMAAGSVVVGALGQCATPRLAKYFAEGRMRAFRELLWALVLTSLGLGGAGLAGALAFGHQALAVIYRPEYATREDVFVWLMAASGMLYLGSTMGVAVTAVRCFAPQLPLFAVSAASTALTCFVLVPIMGLRGAAVAIFVSAIIQCAGGGLLLRNACRRAETMATSA